MKLIRNLPLALVPALLIAACVKDAALPSCDPNLRQVGELVPPELPRLSKKPLGRVDLVFEIDRDGRVTDPRISFSDVHLQGEGPLPRAEYDEVLLGSIRAWRFQPPQRACVMQSGVWFD